MDPLTGKVSVVTGASSGIGRATAVELARAGAHVCVAARRKDRLIELVEELGGSEAGHSAVACDVSDREQVRTLARHVAEVHARCDVLVNNAGVSGLARFEGPDYVSACERVMRTNFYGAVYCTAEMLELLKASAPSNVVNVASVSGRIGTPMHSAYSASKFALVGWAESLEAELAPLGIQISSVEPGFIPTEGFPQKELRKDPLLRHILGTEEQVARAIIDAVTRRKPVRVVPRLYYLLQVPKVLTPPVFRFFRNRVLASDVARRNRVPE